MTKAANESEQVDEHALIRRVVAGERNEFRHLILAHQDRIYSMIIRQVGASDIAKDLAQETFIKAYKNLSGFRGNSSFGTWLTRIALNTTNSYYQSRRGQDAKRLVELNPSEHYMGTDNSDSEQLEQQITQLRNFVGSLSEKYRDVVTLCCFERKSYEEASAILGIAVGTVGSRLSKAFSLLRKKFELSEKRYGA